MFIQDLTLGPREVVLRVYPDNEGPMALVAKRPVVIARALRINVVAGEIEAVLKAEGLKVEGTEISESDRTHIENVILGEILDGRHFPEIRFCGRYESGPSEQLVRVRGDLEIRGVKQPFSLALVQGPGGVWGGQTTLRQSDFRIRPHRAFLGALRSKDAFRLSVEVDLLATGASS